MRICQDVSGAATAFRNNNWNSWIPGNRLQNCANGVGSSFKYKQHYRYAMGSLCQTSWKEHQHKCLASRSLVTFVETEIIRHTLTHINIFLHFTKMRMAN